MLPSPAAERRKTKNLASGTFSLISFEAQRDLVFARAREPLKQRNRQRGSPNRDFETPHGATSLARGSSRTVAVRPGWRASGA